MGVIAKLLCTVLLIFNLQTRAEGSDDIVPDPIKDNQWAWRAHKSFGRLRHSRHLNSNKNPSHFDDLYLQKHHSQIQENHKPVFPNCSDLKPSVKEELPSGTPVIQVTAIDSDPIDNGGKLTYSFVSAPGERLKFTIDPDSGAIQTKHVFDRDEPTREKEVRLTVRATDNGRPQLDAVCSIKITIQDTNDNAPVFDKVNYEESVPQDLMVKQEVMRISATDIDDGKNSIVVYRLEPASPSDDNYFKIDANTGVIHLEKAINKNPGYRFNFRATAEDQAEDEERMETTIKLEIVVVESNKKAPTFTSLPTPPIVLKENLRNFSYNIATLTAVSNTDEAAPVFELVAGRTEQTNKHSTFRLESEGRTAHIRLAHHMDYESITEYTLTIRIQNKFNLAAETTIHIQLEDVNDNIPVFTEVVTGVVLENEPPGTPVMQVRAIDADSTTQHNQVTYELADNQENFKIDLYTGNITTLKTFDREEQDFYNVKVIATDNSPSALYTTGEPNRGQQVFRIEIADKNDHPPRFTQTIYIAEAIPEDANNNALVTEVKAVDNDTASLVTYSIVEGNENKAFLIENKTGKIRVLGQLDYETKTSYTLKVRAFDGAYEDYCTVEIKIENVNDNPPVFVKRGFNNVTINEEEVFVGCIAQLEAYDPDIPDRYAPQHIVYYVVKQDQQKLLAVDKKGCLSLIKPLDRDPPNGFDLWQVIISANDEDGGPTSLQSSTEVVIKLIDVNDNEPYLDMDQPVVWRENQGPDKITELRAKDNDGPTNGPPFTFAIASSASTDIKTKFSITDTTLRALVSFDREETKEYRIPIQIRDSGIPNKTGTSTLTVVIGDVNDNAMKEGHSSIFVYNYKGEAPDTEIGRVYVDDPDDWDLPDKTFSWVDKAHSKFDLNPRTGMITMVQGTTDQSYLLQFSVKEESAKIPAHFVFATVNVTVKEIPEEAVDKSGSVRIAGITAEEFIEPNANGLNKQAILRKYLSKYLNVSEENIDIFTVINSPHNSNATLLDVRFSAHGSPYYSPEKLNAAVSAHNDELEKELGVVILMINIDECMIEKAYCQQSCTNFLNKSNVPWPIYTNTTTFVGVKAVVDPLCSCIPRIVCHNGGTQINDRECICPEGFDGPQCQIVSIGFNGNGFALYPPLEACEDSHLSVEIRSKKPDGLIFYIGPTTKPNDDFYVQDFMSLELKDGFPVLLVDYGTGTVRIVQKEIKLDDGELHRLDIIWSKNNIELQVDNCKTQGCLSLTPPSGTNEFLNVNGPLQVGGSFVSFDYLNTHFKWNHRPTQQGFSGCVRNFTFNSRLYNLGGPSLAKEADVGCSTGVAVAISLRVDTSFLIALLACLAILIVLVLAVVVHRRKTDDLYKDTDDIRENIINYEDEGGGEGDMNAYDLNVLRLIYEEDPIRDKHKDHLNPRSGNEEVPDISGFLDGKKKTVDNDPDTNPFDDVRHYAYEGGDGNSTGSLSSLASGTDEGDLNFDYLSNFGPRFRKLADMYGEDPSEDEDDNYQHVKR
ncbi:DE-cadherin isoform X2 [Cimex lectularius]|uniref:DE-cadherin n=1 Tax=Cimex lectularius TaxID=79782 RepID=A0A8I6RF15_CIMLE|nr:DE-cadherin isoform X2 [Cimex lectularius]